MFSILVLVDIFLTSWCENYSNYNHAGDAGESKHTNIASYLHPYW